MSIDRTQAEVHIREFLRAMGQDVEREGLSGTPARVVKAWEEMLSGYEGDPSQVLKTSDNRDGFAEVGGYDQMIVVSAVPFYSTCEHHLLPFAGHVDVGYLPGPDGVVVGLSKLPRLVDLFARRLQVQERMTQQIAETVQTHLHAQGVGVRVVSEHLCMTCRGVRKHARMVTEALLGDFRDHAVRAEFWELANRGR